MKLIHYTCPEGNFGDDLNIWIWDQLIPGWRDWDDDVTLLGVGTLINVNRVAAHAHDRLLILGTGVGYGTAGLTRLPEIWDVRSLRGPHSARRLGLPEECGLIDPAVMVADFPEFQNLEPTGRTIFVPHHKTDLVRSWAEPCRKLGIDHVSPCGDAKAVISSIARASRVIAESMHAAIIAEAFRVPWVPVRFGWEFNTDKWVDVFEASGVFPDFHNLTPGMDRFMEMITLPRGRRYQARFWNFSRKYFAEGGLESALKAAPVLGDPSALMRRKSAYLQVLAEARRDYG